MPLATCTFLISAIWASRERRFGRKRGTGEEAFGDGEVIHVGTKSCRREAYARESVRARISRRRTNAYAGRRASAQRNQIYTGTQTRAGEGRRPASPRGPPPCVSLCAPPPWPDVATLVLYYSSIYFTSARCTRTVKNRFPSVVRECMHIPQYPQMPPQSTASSPPGIPSYPAAPSRRTLSG